MFLGIDRGQKEIEDEPDILRKLQLRGTYFYIKLGIETGVLRSGEPEIIAWMLVGIAEYCSYLLYEQGVDAAELSLQDAWDIILSGCAKEGWDAAQ